MGDHVDVEEMYRLGLSLRRSLVDDRRNRLVNGDNANNDNDDDGNDADADNDDDDHDGRALSLP